jgi:hypothetical protein
LAARYWVLAPAPELAQLDVDRIHEVDTVELEFDTGCVVRIRWAMAGADEGLDVELDPDPPNGSGLQVIDVGGTASWAALLGQPVTHVRSAWHVLSDAGTTLLWAISIRTEGGGEASIALGEVLDGAPVYLPDSLVVLFSSAEAEAYRQPASTTSAWGTVIEPT